MRKSIKQALAMVIALVMCVTMGMAAFAAPTDTTLKVKDPVDGHTYTAYQLLKGDLDGTGAKLSNVVWGKDAASSITYGTKTVSPVENGAVPADFLEYLQGLESNDQATANAISDMVVGTGTPVSATAINVVTGYYVVKDAYTNPSDPQETTLSTVICDIVGPTEVTPKAGTTEHHKQVLDINDTTDTALDLTKLKDVDASKWDSSADHDFGDHVPFKLTTKIGSDFAKYTSYYLAVNDNLFDGLVLDQNSIEVYVDGVKATEGTEAGQYSLTKADKSFKVEFSKLNGNANAAAGKDVVVYYTATLDAATAKIGNPGNWNESFAEFSNNPNGNQEGKGKTTTETAVVFTYETDVDKLNPDKQPLKGAEFTLTKALKDGSTVNVAVVKFTKDGVETTKVADGTKDSEGDATKFSFKGLDDGTYTLTETVTPDGYNTIDPITFVVSATHSAAPKTGNVDTLEVKDTNGNEFSGEIKFTTTPATGTISTGIVNNEGSTLPSTGGMGTTIFYVIGGILVLAAAIILISRRRVQQ